jgi:TadE-like protein
MSIRARLHEPPQNASRSRGQSLVEFVVTLPVIFLLLIGIADLGRIYTAGVAVESAAREAADFGAFEAKNWGPDPTNISVTLAEMELRACTAAAGSHLQDYESTDPDNKTCSNPSMSCWLERGGDATECATSGGFTDGVDCSDALVEPPCTVHVRMNYDFHLILAIPPFPVSIPLSRDSYFRISDLTPPATSTPTPAPTPGP